MAISLQNLKKVSLKFWMLISQHGQCSRKRIYLIRYFLYQDQSTPIQWLKFTGILGSLRSCSIWIKEPLDHKLLIRGFSLVMTRPLTVMLNFKYFILWLWCIIPVQEHVIIHQQNNVISIHYVYTRKILVGLVDIKGITALEIHLFKPSPEDQFKPYFTSLLCCR